MMKPPTPPPGATEYLSQLAEYYRDLVEYHQQAVIAAAQQLGHVEALLGTPSELSQAISTQSWIIEEQPLPQSIPETPSNQITESSDENGDDGDDEDETSPEPPHVSLQMLKGLLAAERAKMLHIDYIVHYFSDTTVNQQRLKPLIEQQLQEGAKLRMWTQVPDSPDCWTLTLMDFPDFASQNGDSPLFPELKSDVLTTKKVAQLLSISSEKIYELRRLNAQKFVLGVDYFQNSMGHYLWSESGIDTLAELAAQIAPHNQEEQREQLKLAPPNISMLPEYRGLSKEKAVAKFFKNNPDQKITIREMTQAIYGDFDFSRVPHIRESIGKTLATGKQKGLWNRVPGVSGVYQAKKPRN